MCDIRAQVQTGYKEYYDQESSGETKGHTEAGSKNEPSPKNGIEICPAVVKWMWEWKENNIENNYFIQYSKFFAKIDFDFTQKNTITNGGSTATHSKAISRRIDRLDPTQKACPARAVCGAKNHN